MVIPFTEFAWADLDFGPRAFPLPKAASGCPRCRLFDAAAALDVGAVGRQASGAQRAGFGCAGVEGAKGGRLSLEARSRWHRVYRQRQPRPRPAGGARQPGRVRRVCGVEA